MKPKKPIVAAVALAAALVVVVVGCDRNKEQPEDERIANSRFKLLNGSTADSDAKGNKVAAAPEPALNVETRFAAGRLAETQGRLDAAAMQYQQALRLKHDHVPSLYRLGIVYTKTKQFDQATAVWRKYINVTGDIASGYSNLGFCYEMAGDIANAERAYQQGLQRDSKSLPCRTNYGLMLARSNRIAEAQAHLSVVLKPDEVRYNLASVYEQKGELAQAKLELKKAIEINPKNQAAATRLANMPMD